MTYVALGINARPAYLPLSKEDCSDELWFDSAFATNQTSGLLPGARYTYVPITPTQIEM